jgi:cysteine sulfinate desulfinase/cysteine desulfurase-like protein
VPHIAALALPGVTPAALADRGVIVSAGAACHGHGQSHVHAAIGLPDGLGVVRVSLSGDTNADEIVAAARALIEG